MNDAFQKARLCEEAGGRCALIWLDARLTGGRCAVCSRCRARKIHALVLSTGRVRRLEECLASWWHSATRVGLCLFASVTAPGPCRRTMIGLSQQTPSLRWRFSLVAPKGSVSSHLGTILSPLPRLQLLSSRDAGFLRSRNTLACAQSTPCHRSRVHASMRLRVHALGC